MSKKAAVINNGAMGRLRDRLGALREAGISLRQMSQYAGVSYETIRQIIAGTKEIADDQALEVLKRLEAIKVEKRGYDPDEPVPTKNFLKIYEMLSKVLAEKELGVIYGPSGSGKTTALRAFHQDHLLESIYVEVDSTWSSREIYQELLDRLSSENTEGATSNIKARLVRVLRARPKMIILDEADWLTNRSLNSLRQLQERAKVPMVLVGIETFHTRLVRARGSKESLAQLYSRIGYIVNVEPPTEEDILRIINAFGFPISKKVMNMVMAIGSFNLRSMKKALLRAEEIRKANGLSEIDGIVLRQAIEFIELPAGVRG